MPCFCVVNILTTIRFNARFHNCSAHNSHLKEQIVFKYIWKARIPYVIEVAPCPEKRGMLLEDTSRFSGHGQRSLTDRNRENLFPQSLNKGDDSCNNEPCHH